MFSTDLKEMVNNIAIGPGAAMVKVVKVVKKDPYLWRPTPDMYMMEHALQEYVFWPIQKIQLATPPGKGSSPKASSPIASSQKAAPLGKEKCSLLDLENSGEIIAEGKVLSSNPEDKDHFVPLGHDASKVWVQVVKNGKAKVWRPNAEVECIDDALGTTVAWPNDKLVFT